MSRPRGAARHPHFPAVPISFQINPPRCTAVPKMTPNQGQESPFPLSPFQILTFPLPARGMRQAFKLKWNKPHAVALTHFTLIPRDHFSPQLSSPGMKALGWGCRRGAHIPKHTLPLHGHRDVLRVLPWPALPRPSLEQPQFSP